MNFQPISKLQPCGLIYLVAMEIQYTKPQAAEQHYYNSYKFLFE